MNVGANPARTTWNQVKDLPAIEEIMRYLDLFYDNMDWHNGGSTSDVSDWWRVSVTIGSRREGGKSYARKTLSYIDPHQALDLIVGEITRRMGGCPCDKRLEAWKVWCQQKLEM